MTDEPLGHYWASRPEVLLRPPEPIALIVIAEAIPFLPFASVVGLVPISASVLASLAAITIGYVAATELAKRRFYTSPDERSPRR